jgi:hypothetical protein
MVLGENFDVRGRKQQESEKHYKLVTLNFIICNIHQILEGLNKSRRIRRAGNAAHT